MQATPNLTDKRRASQFWIEQKNLRVRDMEYSMTFSS